MKNERIDLMVKRKIFLPLSMLILVLSLTACATDDSDPQPATSDTPPVEDQEQARDETDTVDEAPVDPNMDEDISANEYMNVKVRPEEAFDIFMERYQNAKVEKIQLDKDDGIFIYEIEGFEGNKEYEVKINSMDGEIIKEDVETDEDMDDIEITRAQVEKVMDIVDKALKDAGEGSKLDEWTLEMDDGIAELEIEIDKKDTDDEERTYNVETGELIEIDD